MELTKSAGHVARRSKNLCECVQRGTEQGSQKEKEEEQLGRTQSHQLCEGARSLKKSCIHVDDERCVGL
jgi:hypothetical protein